MKYYKVIKAGFSLDYLTPQDTIGFWCEIGMKIKCDDSKVWFETSTGEWKETINWPHVVELLGIQSGQVEEIK